MKRLVFLLEEQSMKVLLDNLLPRCFPDLKFLCVPHEGREDLERSIPRKLRAWKTPGNRFVILRDTDSEDCRVIKDRIRGQCEVAGRKDTVVRLVCRELEPGISVIPMQWQTLSEMKGYAELARKRDFETRTKIRVHLVQWKSWSKSFKRLVALVD